MTVSRLGRRADQRGNTIVESALILLPMFAMLFAIIDFSVALFMKNTIQYAVRQGVRYAVTGQTLSGMGQDASIKSVVQQNSMGFLNGTTGASYIAISYYSPKTLATVTGVGSNAGGNIVQISVTGFSWAWMVPLWRSAAPLAITAASSDLVETPSNGIPPNR